MQFFQTENEEKTRKAVAVGANVSFYQRRPSKFHYVSLRLFWSETYKNHNQAVQAAEHYRDNGKVLFRAELEHAAAVAAMAEKQRSSKAAV